MDSFSDRVLFWFEKNGRKHLPWQNPSSSYRVWISEIMLQQTQVKTVIPYFLSFLEKFPNVTALANASEDEVMQLWAGLGYYARARNLHKSAKIIRDDFSGVFPESFGDVIALPGVGRSTAGAILSLSMNQPHAILDGNVKRVLSRHQLIDGQPNQVQTLKKQWEIAERFLPSANYDNYTQAMMDIGATICIRNKPLCEKCPVSKDCLARVNQCIDEFPNKKTKKTLPQKQTVMLIITDGLSVYLEKRPSKGIWGGLWSLPEFSVGILDDKNLFFNEMSKFCQKYTKGCILKTKKLESFTHVFTHYRLLINPVIVIVDQLSNGISFNSLDEVGLPKPVFKILEQIVTENTVK